MLGYLLRWKDKALVRLLDLKVVGNRIVVHGLDQKSSLHSHNVRDVAWRTRYHLFGLDFDKIFLGPSISQTGNQNSSL
jgi:hypothetical protein